MAIQVVSPSLAGPLPPQLLGANTCVGPAVPLVKQGPLTWCWAAVGLCLIEFFKKNNQGLDLCGVVQKLLGNKCPAGCTARDCLATQDVPTVLWTLGLPFSPYTFDATLEARLAAGGVIAAEISAGSDTHAVVVHQFCPAENNVVVMDPHPDWDASQGDLNGFLNQLQRAFLLTAADNDPRLTSAGATPSLRMPAMGTHAELRVVFRPHEEVLALARPATQRLPLPPSLHRFAAEEVSSTPWLPRLCWSSQDVFVSDLGRTAFLGWRQIRQSAGTPAVAVDAVAGTADQHVFEKLCTGPAARDIAAALASLDALRIDLTKVSLLEVPCLALHMLRYEDLEGKPKLRGAFSLWNEFQGDLQIEEFVGKARDRAVWEKVTNHV